MAHSIQRNWIHATWTIKDKAPLITESIEKILYQKMEQEFLLQGCPVLIINGTADHVHCLFLLSGTKAVADVLRHVKGSSSHFINAEKLIGERFAWQTGYAAFATSEKEHDAIKLFIRDQKEYHKGISLDMERNTLFAENNVLPDLFDHPSRMVA